MDLGRGSKTVLAQIAAEDLGIPYERVNLNTYVIPKAAGTPRSIRRYSVRMQLVLVHPEIPHNTGCVARLAAATGVRLHLVEPLGFSLEDRYLKRAGLDYWPMVDAVVHADWETAAEFLSSGTERPLSERLRLFTARGGRSLFETDFGEEDLLVFGSESAGLPAALLEAHGDRRVYVPIREAVRSLNLANTVCLGLYTALDRAGLPLPDNDGRYVAHPDAGEEVLPGECVRRPLVRNEG